MTADWSQYLASDEEETAVETQPQEKTFEPQNWNQYLDKKESGFLKEGFRHLARTRARIDETLIGYSGDVVGMVEWLDSKLPEAPQLLKNEPTFLEKKAKEFFKSLPKSYELKEKVSELTSGFTDPQNALEEFGDDITGLATILVTGKDPTKIPNVLKAIGKAVTAKSAGKGAELYGFGPAGQAIAEIGTLFLMGLFGKPTADKFVNDQYKQAREKIPQGTLIPSADIEKSLANLESELSKGLSTATKNEVRGAVSELKAKVSGGAYPAEELVDSFHNINERMTSKKLFDELGKTEKKLLNRRYNSFKNIVSEGLNDYGKSNPEFLSEWKEANSAFSAIAESKKVTNSIEGMIGKLPKHLATGVAIELFHGYPLAAAGTVSSFAGLKVGELLYRVGKSPLLRKHYIDVINAASSENLPSFIKSLDSLDKGLKKDLLKASD